jgi:hypothetical protein
MVKSVNVPPMSTPSRTLSDIGSRSEVIRTFIVSQHKLDPD